MKKFIFVLLTALSLSLFLSTCKKDSSTNGMSTVGVRLKDAPAGWEKFKVQVRGVRIHSDVDGWVTLPVNNTVIDILQLQDSSLLLGNVVLHPGAITEIHLMLGAENTITIGGVTFTITINSGDDDVVIKVHEVVTPKGTFTLVLDLDAANSIDDDHMGHFTFHGKLNEAFHKDHDD